MHTLWLISPDIEGEDWFREVLEGRWNVRLFASWEACSRDTAKLPDIVVVGDQWAKEVCGWPVDITKVLLSWDPSWESRRKALHEGADAVTTLPFEPRWLLRFLDVWEESRVQQETVVSVVTMDSDYPLHAVAAWGSSVLKPVFHENPLDAVYCAQDEMPSLFLFLGDVTHPDLPLSIRLLRQADNWETVPLVALGSKVSEAAQRSLIHAGLENFIDPDTPPELLLEILAEKVRRHARVQQYLSQDALTGLGNIRVFQETLESEVSRAQRGNEPLAVAIVNVDFLKHLNNVYGHPIGDHVILTVARLLRRRLRKSDGIFRLAGDELAAILPTAEGDLALRILDEIRQELAKTVFTANGDVFRVTFSAGLSSVRTGGTPEELIRQAKSGLAEGKRAGRNRCVLIVPGEGY